MRLNYYYNFKNTIRFFIDIENLDFSKVQQDKSSWAEPFKFRLRKNEKSFRTLQIPNIYNFKLAYDYYSNTISQFGYNFENLESLDLHKRMKISYELGEFKENSYDEWQLIAYNQLIDYDLLIRCDIKSFYDNIYTHYIFNDVTSDLHIDKPLSHMNCGRTGGIIMGNYISLFVAELLSKKISSRFENRINELGLDCDFSYFSDDFYIFTSNDNKDKVIKIFDEVLEEFRLEKNEDKLEVFDYLKYTNEDVVEKYWKIITRECKNQQYKQGIEIAKGVRKYNNNLFFTNQLIYRLNKLEDYRKKRVFIVNFFKSAFFRTIDFRSTYFNEYNYHQLLYLIKEFPEISLYIGNILDSFEEFKSLEFINKIINFYNRSLSSNYHDEQLYLYYLLYKLGVTEKVKNEEMNKKVLDSKNYILISYYIANSMFNTDEINIIKGYCDESYWLVYYYLILNDQTLFSDLENSVNKYLIPNSAKTVDVKNAYKEFYIDNLNVKNEILVPLENIINKLEEYFNEKYKKEETDEEIEVVEELKNEYL